jgi:hypothetical protein
MRSPNSAIRIPQSAFQNDSPLHNSPSRDISAADLYASLFIGVSVGAAALGNGMQKGRK